MAVLSHNKAHNRFKNIYPCEYTTTPDPFITYIQHICAQHVADDKSRVCLSEIPGLEGSDYINASFIDVRPVNYMLYRQG